MTEILRCQEYFIFTCSNESFHRPMLQCAKRRMGITLPHAARVFGATHEGANKILVF